MRISLCMLHIRACTRHSRNGVITLCCLSATRGDNMTMETEPRPTGARSTDTWRASLDKLEGLAEVLVNHGLRTRLMTPPGRFPSLHVVNPSAAVLAEDVYAGQGQD